MFMCVCMHTHTQVCQEGGNHVGIFSFYEVGTKWSVIKTTTDCCIQQIFVDDLLYVQQCPNYYLAKSLPAYDFKEIQNAKSEVVNGMLLFTI